MFFKKILQDREIKRICILGVYFGRDIGYMAANLRARKRQDWQITGVDKFEDSPGADWPAEKAGLSWEAAGFGPAPGLEKARQCLMKAGFTRGIALVKDTAENFLNGNRDKFDFIYIDIAHDYKSTRETIGLAMKCLNADGIIAGDDFSNAGTWGVARAVEEAFSKIELHGNWIWQASTSDYRGSAV